MLLHHNCTCESLLSVPRCSVMLFLTNGITSCFKTTVANIHLVIHMAIYPVPQRAEQCTTEIQCGGSLFCLCRIALMNNNGIRSVIVSVVKKSRKTVIIPTHKNRPGILSNSCFSERRITINVVIAITRNIHVYSRHTGTNQTLTAIIASMKATASFLKPFRIKRMTMLPSRIHKSPPSSL